MSKHLEAKIDIVVQKISSIDSTLAGQAVQLKDHIRRTELLETELKPVKKQVDMVQGALKLLGAIGLGALIKALYGP